MIATETMLVALITLYGVIGICIYGWSWGMQSRDYGDIMVSVPTPLPLLIDQRLRIPREPMHPI